MTNNPIQYRDDDMVNPYEKPLLVADALMSDMLLLIRNMEAALGDAAKHLPKDADTNKSISRIIDSTIDLRNIIVDELQGSIVASLKYKNEEFNPRHEAYEQAMGEKESKE